ncbi:hypothetical protein E2C01_078550 [Portunus trituberculatus]|uniref:Uncharacterized protein n=1 Tax=Portunus trituberculatus TaxID=210409 RepID=A0A5B7IEL0_PORTR|nr:hypothetical protein [Portunus trituberculatus]
MLDGRINGQVDTEGRINRRMDKIKMDCFKKVSYFQGVFSSPRRRCFQNIEPCLAGGGRCVGVHMSQGKVEKNK